MPVTVRKPHLVSVAISRRFTDPAGNLMVVSPATGRSVPRGPRGFGYTRRLSPADPGAFEGIWKEIEDRLAPALAAVERRTILGDTGLEQTILDCMAMHWARSADVVRLHDDLFAMEKDRLVGDLARRLRYDLRVELNYRQHHHGLAPAAGERDRWAQVIAEEIYTGSVRDFEASSFRAERMVEWFEYGRDRFRSVGLEVWNVEPGLELLIADAPAQALRHGHPGVGGLGGVPLFGASTVVMPVGPHHAVALTKNPSYQVASAADVDRLNRIQISAAVERVACRPGSGLEGFVAANPAARRRGLTAG